MQKVYMSDTESTQLMRSYCHFGHIRNLLYEERPNAMARITVQDCLSQVGNENRFALIHLAVKRIHQHRDGQPFLVQCKNKEIVSSLREIAAGEVSFDNIAEFDHRPGKPETSPGAEATPETAPDETEKTESPQAA
jgi:DNA-directed RNA polymerase subunit omega